MIQPSSSSDFILIISSNFFYKEVKEKFNGIFEQKNWLFESMSDFINATIISTSFTGLKFNSIEQRSNKNNQKRFYRSGMPSSENMKNKFTVRFRMTSGFLNYFILLEQLMQYNDSENVTADQSNTGNDAFLNPITLMILGEDGEILFERIHSQIVMESIDDLTLNKESIGVKDLEFTVVFSYSNFDIKYNFLEKTNKINPKYVY